MVLRSLIIQAALPLFGKQLPAVSDLISGFVCVSSALSLIMPANDYTDPCHKYRYVKATQ
jgi:hypothetical protein